MLEAPKTNQPIQGSKAKIKTAIAVRIIFIFITFLFLQYVYKYWPIHHHNFTATWRQRIDSNKDDAKTHYLELTNDSTKQLHLDKT